MRTIPAYAALLAWLVLPAGAHAQAGAGKPAASPSPGEEVIVTQSASGEELRGRLVELSRTTLAILVDGRRVDVPIDTVLRIDTRTDSVKNGAIIGAGVLLGGAVITCAAGFARDTAQCVTGLAWNTVFGVVAGAGIDALHKGRTTIYRKPAAVALAVAPTHKGARAQFTLRW